jgi:hypothetical protein
MRKAKTTHGNVSFLLRISELIHAFVRDVFTGAHVANQRLYFVFMEDLPDMAQRSAIRGQTKSGTQLSLFCEQSSTQQCKCQLFQMTSFWNKGLLEVVLKYDFTELKHVRFIGGSTVPNMTPESVFVFIAGTQIRLGSTTCAKRTMPRR